MFMLSDVEIPTNKSAFYGNAMWRIPPPVLLEYDKKSKQDWKNQKKAGPK